MIGPGSAKNCNIGSHGIKTRYLGSVVPLAKFYVAVQFFRADFQKYGTHNCLPGFRNYNVKSEDWLSRNL